MTLALPGDLDCGHARDEADHRTIAVAFDSRDQGFCPEKIISCVLLYGFYIEASPRDVLVGRPRSAVQDEEQEDGQSGNCSFPAGAGGGARAARAGFILAGDAPLPEGVEEGDEGVFVIRLVAVTREGVEAARAAY